MKKIFGILFLFLIAISLSASQIADPTESPVPGVLDVAAMIAFVLASTEIVKKFIEGQTGHSISKLAANAIAILLSFFTVVYNAMKSGSKWDLALLIVFVQVVVGAIGGFKLGKAFFSHQK